MLVALEGCWFPLELRPLQFVDQKVRCSPFFFAKLELLVEEEGELNKKTVWRMRRTGIAPYLSAPWFGR